MRTSHIYKVQIKSNLKFPKTLPPNSFFYCESLLHSWYKLLCEIWWQLAYQKLLAYTIHRGEKTPLLSLVELADVLKKLFEWDQHTRVLLRYIEECGG